MRATHKLWIILVTLALTGCTLGGSSTVAPSTPVVTSTPAASRSPAQPSIAPTATFPTLHTDPGPFPDAAWVLDGVCFEALAQMNGERWSWAAQRELDAFFDRVDDMALCDAPVQRVTFDFTDVTLTGIVQTAQGCDAAHRLLDVVQDEATQTRTLILTLDVRPGCAYELVQLFLVAVPRLPASYTTQISLELP